MARRVFVHVGVPKSGTTFLQTAMWRNRDKLRERGFLYPGARRLDHYNAFLAIRDAPQAEHRADAWERISQELKEWPGDGLVSHEFFSMATRNQALSTVAGLAPAEVHVVVTARDYARQFPAVWQEALKMNYDLPLDEFMKQTLADELRGGWSWDSQDLPSVLKRWAKAVPRDRIHVVTVPPSGAPRTVLWDRWCSVLGIDDAGFDLALGVGNESLGAAQAALLLRVKPHLSGPLLEGPVRHRWLRQYFAHEVLAPQQGDRFGLRDEDVAELRRLSLVVTRRIERRGYQVTGDLSELVPSEEPPQLAHPDDVGEAEMLEVATRAIEQMIRDVRQLTEERDSWRETAEEATALAMRPSLPRRLASRAAAPLRRRTTRKQDK